MEKGVRNIILGFGNGKIVMKTAVLPFLFFVEKKKTISFHKNLMETE